LLQISTFTFLPTVLTVALMLQFCVRLSPVYRLSVCEVTYCG